MFRFFMTAGFVILFLVLSIPVLLIEWIIGKFNRNWKDRSCQAIIQWAFRCCAFLSGARTDYIGVENIPKEGSFLYVGNHRSYFDIVLTYLCFPRPTGYVAKSEMNSIPLLSAWMKNIHCLFLDRKNIKEGMKSILRGIEEIKSGISICIFPEGTRSTTDGFLPFREGSFRMAEKSNCPIIPIAITNSSAVWEEQMPRMKKSHVIIEFGKPIILSELSKENRKFLGAYVQNEIQKMYDKNKMMIS